MSEMGRADAWTLWDGLDVLQRGLLRDAASSAEFAQGLDIIRGPTGGVYEVAGFDDGRSMVLRETVASMTRLGLLTWNGPDNDRTARACLTALGWFVGQVGTTPPPAHPCHVNRMGYIAWHAKARRMTRQGVRQEACPICDRFKYPDEECPQRQAQRAGLDAEGRSA